MSRVGARATKADCGGCRDDYYNSGDRALSGNQCWMLADAKLVVRFRIHRDTRPTEPGAYARVIVPSCKHGNGWYYHAALPDFVPLKNVVRGGSR